MKKFAKKILSNPLISGSAVIFLGSLFGNVFNFLFSVYMLSNLSSADNGILITLISLVTLPSLAANAISPAVVSFAGEYFAKDELKKVRGLYNKSAKLYFCIALLTFGLFLLAIPILGDFFKIEDQFLLLVVDFIVFSSFFNVLNTSFLQAKLSFTYIAFVTIVAAILKFALGVIFIASGFGVRGAIGAVFLSFFVPFLLTFIPLKSVVARGLEKTHTSLKELFSYGLPSALTMLGLTSFITSDIFVVKHFFEPDAAGFYAGISLIGRVVFYFSSPIGMVMFPLVVQKMNRNEKYLGVFLLSIFLVLIPSFGLTLFYFIFPDWIMHLFKLKNINMYQTNFLGLFGMFISLYAVNTVLVNFFLSIRKTLIYIPVLITALMQVVIIWFYHESFVSVVSVSIGTAFLLLLTLLLYYVYATKSR